MIDNDIRAALDECLRALHDGASLDAALARYPDFAAELRPLLAEAQRLRTLPRPPALDPARSDAVRMRYLRRASELRRERTHRRGHERIAGWLRRALTPTPARLTQGFASFAAVFVVLAGVTTWTAGSAGADSPLYGVKLLREDLRQNFTSGDTARARLALDYLDNRESEVRALLADGKTPGDRVLGRLSSNADDAVEHAVRSGDRQLLAEVQSELEAQARLLLFAAPHLEGDTARRVSVLLDDLSAQKAMVARQLVPNSDVEVRNSAPPAPGLQFETARRVDSGGGVVEQTGDAQVLRVGGQSYRVAPGVDVTGSADERLVVVDGADGEAYIVASAPEVDDPAQTTSITGDVTEATSADFRIGDTRILIDDETLIVSGSIAAGTRVAVEGVRDENGNIRALEIRVLAPEEQEAMVFEGVVEDWDGRRWVIDGRHFVESGGARVDLHALGADDSPIGTVVRVEAVDAGDGTYTIRRLWTGIATEPASGGGAGSPEPEATPAARTPDTTATPAPEGDAEAEAAAWEIEGTVVSIEDAVIELGSGSRVLIGSLTEVFGTLAPGARVVMEVRRDATGATVAITVRVIEDTLSAPESEPTAAPQASATATPKPPAP